MGGWHGVGGINERLAGQWDMTLKRWTVPPKAGRLVGMCITKLVGIESNLTFIVDLKHLKHPKDVLCDELGSWKCNGCHYMWVVVNEHGIADIYSQTTMMVHCIVSQRSTTTTKQAPTSIDSSFFYKVPYMPEYESQ